MSGLVERVEAFLHENQLLESGQLVVVGLSGGVDSIVLTSVLDRLRFPLVAVHVNYGLRSDAADDEAFVRSWCDRHGIPLRCFEFETVSIADHRGDSVQQVARDLRYDAFLQVAHENDASAVAVGHHREDQAETVLLHLFRGTGIEGLAGMAPRRRLAASEVTSERKAGSRPSVPSSGAASEVALIRPLLDVSRRDIESYARTNGLSWREDPTNVKSAYRRSAIRAEIMPTIERHFGDSVSDRIARTAHLVRAYLKTSLHPALDNAFGAVAETFDDKGSLRLDALQVLPPVMQRRVIIEALRRWLPEIEPTSTQAEEIESLQDAQVGKRLRYGNGEVWRERKRLVFVADRRSERRGRGQELQLGARVDLDGGWIQAEQLAEAPADVSSTLSDEAFIDARYIRFPLTVRPWQAGDRFSPLGMSRTKKLSDFLTDEHVAAHRKTHVFVVLSGDEIVWVVRHRIAHHVRLRPDTTTTVHLTFHPADN